jgi:hypothetical protein
VEFCDDPQEIQGDALTNPGVSLGKLLVCCEAPLPRFLYWLDFRSIPEGRQSYPMALRVTRSSRGRIRLARARPRLRRVTPAKLCRVF